MVMFSSWSDSGFISPASFLFPEAGVLKKLTLAGLAKLSLLTYIWLRFGLASAGYRGLGVHDRLVYTAG